MGKRFFLTQYWRKLSITTKFTLAFGGWLGLAVLVGLTGYFTLDPVRNQTETTTLTGLPTTIIFVIILITALVLAVLIALLLKQSITHNIIKLTEAATQLQQGDLNVRVEVNSVDELGRLADTFNALATQITNLVDDLEAETEVAQNRLLEAIEGMSEGFSLYDDNGRLMRFNNKYRQMYGNLAHIVNIGAPFEQIIRTAAEQGQYVQAIDQVDAWVQQRIEQHSHPQGILEHHLADGRWMQVSEYKTKDGDIFGLHVDITERKAAETTLRRQNYYLKALHETTISLLGHLNLNALLADIIYRAGELLGAQHGYIYLAETHGITLECKVGIGIYNKSLGLRLKPGEGVAGKVYQSGHSLLINNVSTWSGRSPNVNYDHICSMAGVPLKSGQTIIGVLGLASGTETGQYFDDNEVELLSRFAQLASLALDNAKLYTTAQEEKKRSDNLLNVVIPIGVALSAEQNFDRLLEKILLEAKTFCHADAGTLYLRTENDELKFVIVRNDSLNIAMGGTSGQPIDFPPVPLYTATGEPNHANVAAHVALTGSTTNIPDAYQAEGFNFSGTKNFDQNTGYRSTSFLTIPLKNAHNHVMGVLQLINAQVQGTSRVIPFSETLGQIAASLSSLATVALEAYIREQKLRQQIQQLRIEIDEVKRQKQVTEIVETDFFQDLQIKARNIRRRSQSNQPKR